MSWTATLEGIDPTIFNFLSDVIAVTVNVLFMFSVSSVFVFLMSKHLAAGNGIPVEHLGSVPTNFFTSARLAQHLHWSWPVILLTLLLAVADFSHSIADLGLSFVAVPEEGPVETVLSLATEDRNSARLLELSGDPPSAPRNFIEVLGNREVFSAQVRHDVELIDAFLLAVEHVASGGSPFLGEEVENVWGEATYYGVAGVSRRGNPVMAKLDLALPLNCDSSQMERIEQTIFGNWTVPSPTNGIFSIGFVPNCTFNSPRSSGILTDGELGQAEILETFSPDITIQEEQDKLYLRQAGELVHNILFTPASKALARDRNDWRNGRQIPAINGAQVGNLSLTFGATILALGDDFYTEAQNGTDQVVWIRYPFYYLISNVDGECPPLPSGRVIDRVECLVYSTVHCDGLFQEDLELWIASDFQDPSFFQEYEQSGNSLCVLDDIRIHWGRNFAADVELLAAISAVFSRSRLHFVSIEFRRVSTHAALAALFALGSVVERPSINSNVAPKIDLVYVIFLLLPAVFAFFFLLCILRRRRKLGFPTNAWELLVLGREETELPTRQVGDSEFPKMETSRYEFVLDQMNGTASERPRIHRIGGPKDQPALPPGPQVSGLQQQQQQQQQQHTMYDHHNRTKEQHDDYQHHQRQHHDPMQVESQLPVDLTLNESTNVSDTPPFRTCAEPSGIYMHP